jgi:hypothetical protein
MTKVKGGFIKLERDLVRNETWQNLSAGARALLIEIWSWHNGKNNGSVRYSVRQAEASLRCTRKTAIKRFRELEDARLIEATERGGFRWKAGACEGRATAWRIIPEHNLSKK